MARFDLLLPKENEAELAAEAGKLGIKPIFLYSFKNKKEISKKRAELQNLGIDAHIGLLIEPKSAGSLQKASKLWLSADFVAVISPKDFVRAAVSNPRIDAVFRVPSAVGRDHLEYRRSNFNKVLTNLAIRNKVAYGIDFSYFLQSSGYVRAKILGREMQNVYLCRKLPVVMASFARSKWEMRLPESLSAFGRILGMEHKKSKAAVSDFYKEILEKKARRRSKMHVRPGVEIMK